jgi:protein O-GlcNAc transferase
MKKVISFSLWGEEPKYCVGAIKNAELAKKHYPGWICRYHIGKSTPNKYIEELNSFSNVETILRPEDGDWTGMFWRFFDASDLSVDVMISRDTDSRLNSREASAVKEWLYSNKKFHIMRDHPYHRTEILGGMWGVRSHYLGDMNNLINQYVKGNFWQVDQNFLKEVVYPIVKNNCMVHDEFFEKKPFPSKRKKALFVGQAFNSDDTVCNPEHGDMV